MSGAQLSPAPEADALRRAYLFLRDVEKLQMAADAQVHALPRNHEDCGCCARLAAEAIPLPDVCRCPPRRRLQSRR